MNKRVWLIFLAAVLTAVCIALAVHHANHTSVGIIGGADGPTAIFVASPG